MRGSRYLVLFLTACGGVADPSSSLTVERVTPANGAVDVALDTPITLELSAVPPADFDAVLAAGGEPVAHTVAIAGTTVTLTPTEPLWLASDIDVAVDGFTSSFTTRDGAWYATALHDEVMMGAASLGAGSAPSLAALPDGTVFAGWAGAAALYDQQLSPAGTWLDTPNRLDITGGDPDGAQVAAASVTRAVAGHEKYVTRANIDARTFDGTQWSAPVTVAPYLVGTTRYDQYLGGVAATAQSYALVFHRGSFSADLFDLYVSIHTGSWSAPVLVEKLSGSASGGEIIADGKDGYVVAWSQQSADKTSTAVWLATVSASGTVGEAQMLDDGPGATYAISLARSGDTIWLAWARRTGNVTGRVIARSFGPGGLGTAHVIELDGLSAYGEWARIAASATGALLAYTQYGRVFAVTLAGASWSTPVEVDPQPMLEVSRPAVALDDRGNGTVLWTRMPGTGSGRSMTMVARSHAGTWLAPVQLDDGTGDSYVWDAGVDAAGRVTTAWTQSTADGYAVWGAHLQ